MEYRAYDKKNKVWHYDVQFITSGCEENDWLIFKSDKQTLEKGNVFDNPYSRQQIVLYQFYVDGFEEVLE